jgi:hypothetical protein
VKRIDIINRAYGKAAACNVCRERVFEDMQEFIQLFMLEIEKVIAQVSAGIPLNSRRRSK